jgi:hypothetical protein
MPLRFNPIACAEWLDPGLELEAAGRPFGRIRHDAVRCAFCGTSYSLVVQLSLSEQELLANQRHFEKLVSESCGNHRPILQLDA